MLGTAGDVDLCVADKSGERAAQRSLKQAKGTK